MSTQPGDLRCCCAECAGPIAFPMELLGQTIACPHCGVETWLQPPRAAATKPPVAIVKPPAKPVAKPAPSAAKKTICATCYAPDSEHVHTKGSIIIELGLWMLILVPGLIYSIWRLASRVKCCKACGSTELIPAHTPRGRELAAKIG
jgi:hypothetical protein